MIIYLSFLQVAILNGLTFGAGAGISFPGMFRVVTDKTVCTILADYDQLGLYFKIWLVATFVISYHKHITTIF